MQKIPKQEFTAEVREQAVNRVKVGKSVSAVDKEMGPRAGLEGNDERGAYQPAHPTQNHDQDALRDPGRVRNE